MDWVDPISSELVEEREGDMSSLAYGFSAHMCKRVASPQRETTPCSEASEGKSPKRSGLDEEAHKGLKIIVVDSLERAFNTLPEFEGVAQDASKEACASLEDGAPARGPPKADQAVSEASATETTISLPLQAIRSRLTI